MATTKRRIPVTLPADLEHYVEEFAAAHGVSLSQAMALLMRYGIDMAEDDYFGLLADNIDAKVTKWEAHNDFWTDILPA